jgi:hypothetical protein
MNARDRPASAEPGLTKAELREKASADARSEIPVVVAMIAVKATEDDDWAMARRCCMSAIAFGHVVMVDKSISRIGGGVLVDTLYEAGSCCF